MRSYLFAFIGLMCCCAENARSQVDSAFIFKSRTVFGGLDIRLSKGPGHVYYLQEGVTFSFRKRSEAPTETYHDMTAWDSKPYTEGNLRQRDSESDMFVMNYRFLNPEGYRQNLRGGYPLVVVLHGFLERGNCAGTDCYHADNTYSPNENIPPAPTNRDSRLLNNDYNLIHAGSNYLEARNIAAGTLPTDENLPATAFPGFVLFPQNLNGWDTGSAEDVIRLIRLLCKRYNIDQERIYINGISHGGRGAYEVLKRAPWMFAAGVMFSAADDASILSQKAESLMSGVPLWIFQGALDTNPAPARTERYVRAFRRAGATVRYTLYPTLGHGTWNKALSEPDFFAWMLGKRRSDIDVFGGIKSICATSESGTSLSLPEGFKRYEWEYNGQVIERAISSSYVANQAGDYRGRFLINTGETQSWSDWSRALSVDAMHPEAPRVRQVGTLLLPDLNGRQEAILESEARQSYYYWHKDGGRLHDAAAADTLHRIVLRRELGGGSYSLTVSGYERCMSPHSEPMEVRFNSTAPVTLAAPYNLVATAGSPSEINLTWSDTTRHERGFEVWRRTLAPGDTSLWEMVVLTDANATGYSDSDATPSATYEYKVRAVGSVERSLYTPDAAQLLINTPADTQPPGSPGTVSASLVAVNTIELTWKAADDNASIQEYIICYGDSIIHTGTADTVFAANNLLVNTVYSFEVRAVDVAGNVGPPSTPIQEDTFLEGLFYTHSTGAWQSISEVDWAMAEFSGIVGDFNLSRKTQEDFFNFMFDGFLSIQEAGTYQFRITSDDGSNLSLNDTLLIENDGIHVVNTVTGPVQILRSGPQRITVKYFDYETSDTLLVEYKGPDTGNEWVSIPEEFLRSNIISSTNAVADGGLDFNIYPNPARNGTVHVEVSSLNSGAVHLRIHDMSGNVALEYDVALNGDLEITIPESVAAGVYLVTVYHGTRKLQKRLVIR